MTLNAARTLALTWRRTMLPFCHVCAVAGSVRREKPEVRDLEIVAVPRWYRRAVPARPEAGEERINALYEAMIRHAAAGAIRWIKPATSEIHDWPLKPDGKYWRGLLPTGVKLDLFLASRGNFGLIMLIRTGSAAFSKTAMVGARRIGRVVAGGHVYAVTHDPAEGAVTSEGAIGDEIPTPTEEAAFRALGIVWVEPRDRTDGRAIRPIPLVSGRV
ncbi:MAG TPA: hypothetical protein VGR71_06215 [Nitrospira sp.]|nr:hypothetical protein [Nitrospira sp.]